MAASEQQTYATPDARVRPGPPGGADPEQFIRDLRSVLPGSPGFPGGHWQLVSLKFVVPPRQASGSASTDEEENKDEKKKKDDDEETQDAPIKPGGPRIEAVYEWV